MTDIEAQKPGAQVPGFFFLHRGMEHPQRGRGLARARRRRRWIVAVSTAAGMATLSAAGAFWRGQPHPPPPASTWVAFAVLLGLVTNVMVTRWALRRVNRPRCAACGAPLEVSPRWAADQIRRCGECGRATVRVGNA